jgi:sugar/nucleoside kinase (ribokinase family)
MSAIWRRLQAEVCPRLSARRRYLFFDLADTEKRDPNDIREALDLIGSFGRWYDTTLGLNEKESEHICEVLGLHLQADSREALMQARAAGIRQRLGLGSVVVHPVAFAAAADAQGSAVVPGPYVKEPLISTGAGDHFNAGYFLGRCLGADLEVALQLGVGTSGYYVRTAESPSLAKLRGFLASLNS